MNVARNGAPLGVDPAAFSVAVAPGPDGYLVKVRGELDIYQAPRLTEELERLNSWNLVLDLSGVSFIDSTGLRVLFEAARRAGATQTELLLRCSSAVSRTLSLCGVDANLCPNPLPSSAITSVRPDKKGLSGSLR
jgi:anti-sigma B factor antagonist